MSKVKGWGINAVKYERSPLPLQNKILVWLEQNTNISKQANISGHESLLYMIQIFQAVLKM